MNGEFYYNLWVAIKHYIGKKDVEEAAYTFLSHIGEEDESLLDDIRQSAIEYDDTILVKVIKELSSEYDDEDEYDEEYEEW